MRIFVVVFALTITGAFGQVYNEYGGNGGGSVEGSIGGSFGGSIDGNVEGSIDRNIAGNADSPVNGGATIDGSITANTGSVNVIGGFDASMCMCMNSCMSSCSFKNGLAVSGQAGIGVNGEGEVSANGELNWPDCSSDGGSDETTTVQAGYKYIVYLHRTIIFTPVNDVVAADPINEANQPITYYKTVDAENPFYIDGRVTHGGVDFYEIPRSNAISSCEEYDDGTWDYFLAAVIRTQLMPNGTCPVEPGTYTMYSDLMVPVTFDEMLQCGDYEVYLDIDNAEKQWSFKINYEFTIPNDGTCTAS